MRKFSVLYFLNSQQWLSKVTQVPLNSTDPLPIQGFYSSFSYDGFKQLEVPSITTTLLPFQKEGICWMADREMKHIGGIMADHLGMGKTVQMIGLCLVSDNVDKLLVKSNMQQKSVTEGSRLLTVLHQLNTLSVVSLCSRINQPARDMKSIIADVEKLMKENSDSFAEVHTEVEKWVKFASKFHPGYAKRALAFLKDEEKRDFKRIRSTELRTLVVVPASLLLQWKSEIETKVDAKRGIRVYLYHGDNKNISPTELETFDFVLTTYDTLTHSASCAFIPGDDGRSFAFARNEAGPIFHITWKRIILDEAHMIRHSKTQRWRAIQELRGIHRWAVTATPLHNSLEDLQNLLYFIGLPKLPLLSNSSGEDVLNDPAIQRSIAQALQPAFLRRGPVMKRNGVTEVLVSLPPKTEVVVKDSFSVKESQLYNSVLAKSRSALASSEKGKEGTFHIFAMMTRLRQVCCHPWINQGRAVKISICGICKCEAVSPVTTKCGHTFCNECFLLKFREEVDGDEFAVRVNCPSCEAVVTFNSVFKKHIMSSPERIAAFKLNEFELSTKLKMILKVLSDVNKNHRGDKTIIFSQFTSFLDVISVALDRYHIEHLRIDGTMTLSHRNSTIRSFQTSNNIRVILASKTATGVGLNLTAANHVIVVDPWWNPAIEEQAVHRCYRIGQKKPVYVTRLLISDTIEQYCFDICQKKKEFGDAVLKAATSNDSSSKVAASRLQQLISRLSFVKSKSEKQNKQENKKAKAIEPRRGEGEVVIDV